MTSPPPPACSSINDDQRDPAIDARVAWNLFDDDARAVYRAAAGFDDDAWERGKGSALTGVAGIVHYRDSNLTLARNCIQGVQAVLDQM